MVELYSCIASESQKFFKRVFYLKQINFITAGPLPQGPWQLAPLPLLIRPWKLTSCTDEKIIVILHTYRKARDDARPLKRAVIFMGVRRNFSRGGKVDILHILFGLLMMQRKWTYTKRFNLSTRQRKCPMLRQQLHTVFFL